MPRRFFAGDVVICTCGLASDQFTKGKSYIVGGHHQEGYEREDRFYTNSAYWVGIVADDRGRPNGWTEANFEAGGGPW